MSGLHMIGLENQNMTRLLFWVLKNVVMSFENNLVLFQFLLELN